MSQLGQFCSGNNLPAPTAAHIKTENGYSDCMLALDYAQNKVRNVWNCFDPSSSTKLVFIPFLPLVQLVLSMGG